MDTNIKVVGRRIKTHYTIEEADVLLGLASVLRRGEAFVPKGVYRFKTHEEANRWQFQMVLGQKPGSPE